MTSSHVQGSMYELCSHAIGRKVEDMNQASMICWMVTTVIQYLVSRSLSGQAQRTVDSVHHFPRGT